MADAITGGMVARIKNILLNPKSEWRVIDGEPATIRGLITGYVMPLAAIGPLAWLIGMTAFGYQSPLAAFRPSLNYLIAFAVISYLLAVAGVWINGQIISALATSFGGTPNPVQATKVAAYSATASFVAGIFSIHPALSVLGLLGLYGLYLLYTGLPVLMKSPPDKSIAYIVVVIIVSIVTYLVLASLAAAVAAIVAPPTSSILVGP